MTAPPLNRIAEALELRRRRGAPILDLSAANPSGVLPPFPPASLIEASTTYFQSRCYEPDPRGSLRTRAAIASWYAARHQLTIDPDRIIITASTSESYQLLLQCLCPRGSSVIVPSPSYPLLEEFAAQRGITIRGVPLRRYDHWRYSPYSFEGFLDSSVAAIVLVSPNNPTGTIASAEELRELIKLLRPLPGQPPLIIDEVFSDALFEGNTVDQGSAVESDYPVILLNGISKSFCSPDLKVGWIVMNEAAWYRCGEQLLYANDMLLSCSGLSQHLVMIMMHEEGQASYRKELNRALSSCYESTMAALRSRSWVRPHPPQGGWMVFAEIETPGLDEEEFFVRAALEGIALHPGHFYGTVDRGIFGAFSILVPLSALEEGLAIIERLLTEDA